MGKVTETTGDIFTSPPGSILIHACNALGAWGSGVALAFKQHYPAAYTQYHAHCCPAANKIPSPHKTLAAYQRSLVGTTLLIPPCEDEGSAGKAKRMGKGRRGRHYVACLFTSYRYGRNVDSGTMILDATRLAMRDLERQVRALGLVGGDGSVGGKTEAEAEAEAEAQAERGAEVKGNEGDGEEARCKVVKINSGSFGVEWDDTRAVLEEGGLDVCVVSRAEDASNERGKRKRGSEKGGGGEQKSSTRQKTGMESWLRGGSRRQ